MSIANVYLAKDFALIGSDTAGRLMDGREGEPDISMCKLLPVPLCNAILAARGERTFYSALWFQLVTADGGDFDALVEELPAIIEKTIAAAHEHQATPYTSGNWALVGWSRSLARMRCVGASMRNGELRVLDSADGGWRMLLAPGEFGERLVPQVNTPEAMMDCARIQVKLVGDLPPEQVFGAIGGDLLLAVLQPHRLEIENLGPI